MNTSLNDLSAEDLGHLARIRISLTARLVAAASRLDPELGLLCSKPFSLGLGALGLSGPVRIVCAGGSARVVPGARPASGWLIFTSAGACARALSGGKGAVLPLPLAPSFARALKFFRTAARRAPALLRDASVPAKTKAPLLLEATLAGLEAVCHDPYLFPRLDHIPDGIELIRAGGAAGAIEKRGRSMRMLDEIPRERPSAVLSFRDEDTAVKVLSGKRQAVVALGLGEVRIEGLLPLVQGLFGVMDRFSWYLDVSLGEVRP